MKKTGDLQIQISQQAIYDPDDNSAAQLQYFSRVRSHCAKKYAAPFLVGYLIIYF